MDWRDKDGRLIAGAYRWPDLGWRDRILLEFGRWLRNEQIYAAGRMLRGWDGDILSRDGQREYNELLDAHNKAMEAIRERWSFLDKIKPDPPKSS